MYNQAERIADAWQKEGDTAAYQIYTAGYNGAAMTAQSRYSTSDAGIVDASYVRLKNIAISYNLPLGLAGMQTNPAKLPTILSFICVLSTISGYACVNCNKKTQNAVSESLHENQPWMFSAFIVLALVVLILIWLTIKNLKIINLNFDANLSAVPFRYTAMVLGMGLGGFADGIVLHQILQWHQMLSNKINANTLISKSVNMFWDGIFHLLSLLTTLAGIYLFWKTLQHSNIHKSNNLLIGGLLTGWGIFNIIEGVINHQILKLHNVREITNNTELWNYGFLFFGIILIFSGWLTMHRIS